MKRAIGKKGKKLRNRNPKNDTNDIYFYVSKILINLGVAVYSFNIKYMKMYV